jgi:uncharacterized membrane protein HdeD (DUF308 family)
MISAKQKIIELAKAMLLVQGSLAIVFGLAAMFWPDMTVLALAYLFAIFLIADGSVLLIASFCWKGSAVVLRLLWGLLQVLLGIFILHNPQVSFAVLIVLLGLSLAVRGVFSLAHAVTRKTDPPQERIMHGVLGGLGIIVGAVIIFQPAAGGLAFVWVLGLYALITGSLLIGLAFGAGSGRHGRNKHHATD